MSEERVFVTTIEGNPSFLVHRNVRDKFITEEVERRYGKQDDGSAHAWEAYDEAVVVEEAQARAREAQQ